MVPTKKRLFQCFLIVSFLFLAHLRSFSRFHPHFNLLITFHNGVIICNSGIYPLTLGKDCSTVALKDKILRSIDAHSATSELSVTLKNEF